MSSEYASISTPTRESRSRLHNSVYTPAYKVSAINEEVWNRWNIHPILSVVIALLALCCSVVASFPYLSYSTDLPESVWLVVCVTRSVMYAVVFSGYWMHPVIYRPVRCVTRDVSLVYILRVIMSALFAVVYTFLYSVKWYTADVLIRDVSVPLFSVLWLCIFYSVIDKHLSNSISVSGIPSSRLCARKRRSMLDSISDAEKRVASEREECARVYNIVHGSDATPENCVSEATMEMLFAQEDVFGYDNIVTVDDRLLQHEERVYDPCRATRAAVVNVFLGVCLVPLSLAMMEDYGYPLAVMIKDGNKTEPLPISVGAFLSIETALSCCLSVMYTVAVYPIAHKYASMRCSIQNNASMRCSVSNVKALIFKLPIALLAGVLASVRMNSSYSIFGHIAARCGVPLSLEPFFVWTCVSLVFLIDFLACVKVLSCALKKWMSILAKLMCVGCLTHTSQVYKLRPYFKKMKQLVRDCDEETVCELFDAVM